MNLFQPTGVRVDALGRRRSDYRPTLAFRNALAVPIEEGRQEIDLDAAEVLCEPGTWIVGSLFQYPILIFPNQVTVQIIRGGRRSPAPVISARFHVPEIPFEVTARVVEESVDRKSSSRPDNANVDLGVVRKKGTSKLLGDPPTTRIRRTPEEQRQFDLEALFRILAQHGVSRQSLERCGVCDGYRVTGQPCLVCPPP